MFKKALVVATFVTAIAAPAFAQSSDPDAGTGNVLPFAYAPTDHSGNDAYAQAVPTAKHSGKSANIHRSAKSSYASAPIESKSDRNPYSPANTGGGSEGYNWNLVHGN